MATHPHDNMASPLLLLEEIPTAYKTTQPTCITIAFCVLLYGACLSSFDHYRNSPSCEKDSLQ